MDGQGAKGGEALVEISDAHGGEFYSMPWGGMLNYLDGRAGVAACLQAAMAKGARPVGYFA